MMRAIASTTAAALLAMVSGPGLVQQPTLEQRFRQSDRNADGKLTPQELPGEWFGRLDTNRDGVVTLDEVRAGRRQR